MHSNKFKIYVLLSFFVSIFFSAQQTNASISQHDADFGAIVVGSTSTIPIYITNREIDRTISVTCFIQDGSHGFSIETDFLKIAPDQTEVVNVLFAPPSEGDFSGTLFLAYTYDDTLERQQTVPESVTLIGSGIIEPERNSIEDILDFYDASVDAENLSGVGPGESAEKRLIAFRNMIVTAINLIHNGNEEEAYGQLKAALKKIDPPDTPDNSKTSACFVTGDAVNELIQRIEYIMSELIS